MRSRTGVKSRRLPRTYDLETKSQRRDFGDRGIHVVAAVVVERSLRECPAGAGFCVGREPFLQAGLRGVSHRRLLADECSRVYSDAQRRAESVDGQTGPIFATGFAQRYWNLVALHGANRGVAEAGRSEADRELFFESRRALKSNIS